MPKLTDLRNDMIEAAALLTLIGNRTGDPMAERARDLGIAFRAWLGIPSPEEVGLDVPEHHAWVVSRGRFESDGPAT